MAAKTKTPTARSLPFNTDELLKLCREAEWEIGRHNARGTLVKNPDNGATALISNSVRPGTRGNNLHAQLTRNGLLTSLAKAQEKNEEDRRAAIDADRGAAEAAIEAAQAAAEAAQTDPGTAVVRHLVQFTPPAVASTNGSTNGQAVTPAAMPKKAPPAKPAGRSAGKPADSYGVLPSTRNTADGPPPMYVERVTVTPELALEWLTREEATLPDGTRVRQRTRRPAHVAELVRAMANGDWLLTSQGIALAPEAPWNTGAVLDGQHRLEAVIEYGYPVDFMVAFNTDPATFKVLDTGKARSGADVLTTLGYKSTMHLSSVAKLVHVWELWMLDPTALADWRNWPRIKVSNIEIAETIQRNPGLDQAMNDTRALTNAPLNYNLPAATVFRLWLGNVWPAGSIVPAGEKLCPIDAWLDKLRLGIGLGQRTDPDTGKLVAWPEDPMLVVRNWAQNPKKITRLYPGAVREASLLALIRAWNYSLKNRGMGYVHIKAGDVMPTPIPGPQPE